MKPPPEPQAFRNTDREIWRRAHGDDYSPSIHATKTHDIGINVGGHTIVATVERWHLCGQKLLCVDPRLPRWRYRLAMWLLGWNRKDWRLRHEPL